MSAFRRKFGTILQPTILLAIFSAILSSFIVASSGCALNGTNGSKCFLRRWLSNSDAETLNPLTSAETILRVDGRIAAIRVAPNSKRAIVERRNPTLDGEVFELWNLEFSESRRETFGNNDDFSLSEDAIRSAAFNDDGERVFWTAREVESVAQTETTPQFPLQFSSERTTGVAQIKSSNDSFSFQTGEKTQSSVRSASATLRSKTMLATRAFEQPYRISSNEFDGGSKQLKTAPETQRAANAWLSPNARWIVCRLSDEFGNVAVKDVAFDENADPSTSVEPSWRLVLREDRRRVVCFPDVVKMEFGTATSQKTVEGRVVDVLAISDAGDLAATLVEEYSPKNDQSQVDVLQDLTPRCKIVVWDLSVSAKVDWEKAKKPLKALEVAQIALSAPVERRFCRFSPNGTIFAARLEPRYLTLWQSANGRLLTELGEHKNAVADFTFSPNGLKIAVASGGKEARIVVWDVRRGVAQRILDDFSEGVTEIDAVAYSPDGNYLFFANNFGEIKRWEVRLKNKTSK